MTQNYEYASIHESGVLIRAQKISPVEVVQACLKRIEELDPRLNAFIIVLADQAFEQAKDAGEEIKAGNWQILPHRQKIRWRFYEKSNFERWHSHRLR